jgi:ribonuclease P protein component
MIPRKSKADTILIKEIFKNGLTFHTPLFSVRVLKTPSPRYSVIAPSSIAKKAVDRVKLKRRAYKALAPLTVIQDKYAVVFILKSLANKESVENIQNSMKRVLENLR